MSLSRLPSRAGRPNGFTLLEALIALTVLGVALLLGMALVIQLPRDVRRLDAERNAMRAMEATLEALRAGTPPPDPGIKRFSTSTTTPGLCQVTLTVQYTVLNSQHHKQLQALIRSSNCFNL